jgi:hypothetical protein
MKLLVPLAVSALTIGGVALVASAATMAEDRKIWLINGKRYALVHRFTGPGWDASMYPGFCDFSEPVLTSNPSYTYPQSPTVVGMVEVQFMANWCAANTHWQVPDEIAIAEAA